MNRGEQGSVLLAIAGSLMIVALVSYAISDADVNAERRNALIRNRQLLREQADRLIEERKAINVEIERMSRERSLFSNQQDAIIKSLQRLERSNQSSGTNVGGNL